MVALAVTLLMSGHVLGLIPNERDAVMAGRSQLCESLAINFSLLAQKADVSTLRTSLMAIQKRNPDVISLGIRRNDGKFLFQVGPHAENWVAHPTGHSTETHMYVPITRNGEDWGTVEVCFTPIHKGGIVGILSHPAISLTLFMSLTGLPVFFIYLRSVLTQLNPSKVVPRRVKSALDTLAEGLLVLDKHGRIVLANSAFTTTCEKTIEELIGKHPDELPWRIEDERDSNDSQAFSMNLPWVDVLSRGEAQRGRLLGLESKEGVTFVVNAAPIVDEKGDNRGVITSFEDVSKLQQKKAELASMLDTLRQSAERIRNQNKELERLATRDPMTGCLNRRSFFIHFDNYWSESARHDDELSCVMVDVDHFKSINDNHGHSVGDDVLKAVARCLLESARDYDIVARYGGEEFSILMPRTNISEAAQAAERVRQALEALKIGDLKVTASLGVSCRRQGAGDPQQMLDQADKCLYFAKRNGRNQVASFDQIPDEFELEEETSSSQSSPEASKIPYPAVTALTSALAYRDNLTASHSRRVADLCVAVGQGLMSLSSCYVLEIAALLHDIGKIGVPDSILLKTEALTPDEWAVMRHHDRIGVEIIRASFGSEDLTEIVENYRRYFVEAESPGAIPLGARILAVADAYDSMITDKPYRPGRTPEEAFAELRQCAGSQFDPAIVDRFIEAVRIEKRTTPVDNRISRETALGIGIELERLATAVDQQNLQVLKAMATRLAAKATKSGAHAIAERALELQDAVVAGGDLIGVLRTANDLLEECRSTQASFVDGQLPAANASSVATHGDGLRNSVHQ